MLWARLNRGGLCGGVSWRRPVSTVTVTVYSARVFHVFIGIGARVGAVAPARRGLAAARGQDRGLWSADGARSAV